MKPNRFARAQLAKEQHPITKKEQHGKQTHEDVNDWQQEHQMWTCPYCQGFGYTEPHAICPSCFGFGKIDAPKEQQ
jgi:rubrerythrin